EATLAPREGLGLSISFRQCQSCGSLFCLPFPEKAVPPDFKKAGKPRHCCLTFASSVRGPPDGGSSGFRVVRTRDPIPLPQRLGLLCAAKGVERVGSAAGAVVGQIVVSSECDVVAGRYREGALEE